MPSASEGAPPNLYLVGFMGTGKSAVARAVARPLGLRAIDSDAAIEAQAGAPISELFAREGEVAFRARERAWMESGHPARGAVVACGGGLIIPPGMVELVRRRGVVICLFASIETILERTSRNSRRPLLQVEDPAARIRELLAVREPIYLRAGPGVWTDNRSLAEIAAHVARVYRAEAPLWLARHGEGGTLPPG